MPKLFIELFSGAIRGKKRETNEDTAFGFLTAPLAHPSPVEMLGVIGAAGGMGGAGAGDAASADAHSFIESVFTSGGETNFAADHGISSDDHIRLLGKVFDECNRIILNAAVSAHKSGLMGTTLALGVIVYNATDNKTYLHVGNVGNCRGYIIRGEQIFHATEEDSVAWRLYKKGAITYSELLAHPLRTQITVMGIDTSVSPEVHMIELRAGDTVIFCTDGVHEALDDPAIFALTRKYSGAKKTCEHLLEAARAAAGGKDNVAAAMAVCSPVPLGGATKHAPAQTAAGAKRRARRSKAMIAVWSTVGVLAVAAAIVYFQQPAALWSVKDFFSPPPAAVVPQITAHKEMEKNARPAAGENNTRAQVSDASEHVGNESASAPDEAEPAVEKSARPSESAASNRPAVKPTAPAVSRMKVEWNAETERFRITTSSSSTVPTQIRYGSQVFDVVPVKTMPNLYRTTKPLSRAMISSSKVVHVTVADSKNTVAVVFTQNQ